MNTLTIGEDAPFNRELASRACILWDEIWGLFLSAPMYYFENLVGTNVRFEFIRSHPLVGEEAAV